MYPPLIKGAEAPNAWGAEISFLGLVEGKVISACRDHGIPLQRIRAAREYLRTRLEIEHPLATHRLLTDGARILDSFERQEGDWPQGPTFIDVGNEAGQSTLAGFITDVVDLLEFVHADDDWANRFYPAGRAEPLVIDPRIVAGAVHIVDHGIRVETIVGRYLAGENTEFIANDFGLTVAHVDAALRFAGDQQAA